MSLTDSEIVELEELLHIQEIRDRRNDLKNHFDRNPNYSFLVESFNNRKYVKGKDEAGKEIDVLVDGYRGVVLEGSSRCFSPEQLVITARGSIPIKDVNEGDLVSSIHGFKEVIQTHRFKNKKKSVRIKLKNGNTISCTEDHEFFFEGAWMPIKHILSLKDEKNTKL